MEMIRTVMGAPEMYLFRWVAGSYGLLYILVLTITHITLAVRGEKLEPLVDRIVHVSTMIGFVLITVLPLLAIVLMVRQHSYSSIWYFAPYLAVALLNLICVMRLLTKPNPSLS